MSLFEMPDLDLATDFVTCLAPLHDEDACEYGGQNNYTFWTLGYTLPI